MLMLVQPAYLLLSSATLSNEIFSGSFLVENHVLGVCNSSETNLFLSHRNRKVVGDKHNVLVHFVNVCTSGPAGVVLWNPLK